MLKIIITVILSILLCSCSSLLYGNVDEKVTALSFYPNCNYETLGTISAQSGKELNNVYYKTNSPLAMRVANAQGTQEEALTDLKLQAIKLGANAIAITAYENEKKLIEHNVRSVITLNYYNYTAEAIKDCEDEPSRNNRKTAVKYLSDGTYNL